MRRESPALTATSKAKAADGPGVPEPSARILGHLPEKKEGLLPFFEKLSYTHRKEYCRWISEAKKEETRLKRLGKAIERLEQRARTPR
jgi:uncharacterized protein YdeI (YjbR/CyaY-like superfamily)